MTDSIESLREFAGRRLAASEGYDKLVMEYRKLARVHTINGREKAAENALQAAQWNKRKADEAHEAAQSTLLKIKEMEAAREAAE